MTSLAIDPLTPATIYAGTAMDGIYKSINAGANWTPINNGLLSLSVHNIVINPTVTSTIYAATSGGIYKSTDAGATWSYSGAGLIDPDVNVLVIDPRNPNLLYAGTASSGVFRSLNGGSFWLSASGGLTSSSLGILVTAMTIDPVSGTLYAATGESDVSTLYKSSNGTTWSFGWAGNGSHEFDCRGQHECLVCRDRWRFGRVCREVESYRNVGVRDLPWRLSK